MRRASLHLPELLALLAFTGCAAPIPEAAPPPQAPSPRVSVVEGASLAHEPAIRASLKGPSRAPYVVEALGIGTRSVAVQLTNTGPRSANLEKVRVGFTATRKGVSYLCKEPTGASPEPREPASLAPGQSFVFTRDLDCTMPLPGRYDVGVYVAIGDASRKGRGDFVGTFSLEVVDGSEAPRAYPSREGLYAVMTGSGATRPLPPEAWSRGDYRVVVAVVNASPRPISVGRARLAFLTYRKGSPLPCSGEAASVAFPDELPPGGVHVIQSPVACAPAEEGRYVIVGRLTLDGGGDEIEIGRVSLKVTRDPLLFVPERWSSWDDGASQRWTK